jgi:hypothetical protein
MKLLEALREIRDSEISKEAKAQALRELHYKRFVSYYNDGTPVKWTEKQVERAVKYQMELWRRCGMFVEIVGGSVYFKIYDHGANTGILKAEQMQKAVKNLDLVVPCFSNPAHKVFGN